MPSMQKIHFYFYKCIMDIFKLLYFTLLYLLLLKELLCNRQQGCTLMKTTDFFWRKLQKEDDNEVSLQKENATKSKVKKKNKKKLPCWALTWLWSELKEDAGLPAALQKQAGSRCCQGQILQSHVPCRKGALPSVLQVHSRNSSYVPEDRRYVTQ